MFDAWNLSLAMGGAAALGYIAAGPRNSQNSLRISLTENNSLLGDVRLLGGLGAFAVANWMGGIKKETKDMLNGVAFVSGLSLVTTESIRYRFQQEKIGNMPAGFVVAPDYKALMSGGEKMGGVYGAAPAGRHFAPSGWSQHAS